MKVRSAREAMRCLDTANDFFKVIGASYFEGVLELAMSALEKQIPKKPEKCNMKTICPECSATVLRCYHHCRICGQAIDWNEYEARQ